MSTTDVLRRGMVIRHDGHLFTVLDFQTAQSGKQRPTVHVKLRDLKNGNVGDRSLDQLGKIDEVQTDKDGRKALTKWAIQAESCGRVRAAITMAESESAIAREVSQFDQKPWALNVLNGTLDLLSGELRPHRASDNLTKLVPAAYDPQAECPRWHQFLREVLEDNTDLAEYVQRVAGYALTNDTSEQCWWFLYGGGPGR